MSAGSTGVQTLEIAPDEADIRLDRWFRRHYPELTHGRLEKLLRTGQVRVDGKRAKAGLRLVAGQSVRVPPLQAAPARAAPPAPRVSDADASALRDAVLHRDDEVIAIDKPPGLAVQGGSKTVRHLDLMLDALRFGSSERPRLVHRLDKDTSGVLLLARSAAAAGRLAAAFRDREAKKIYWALVVGRPSPRQGRIDLALAKLPGKSGERMVPAGPTGGSGAAAPAGAKQAITLYTTIESAGNEASWLALWPRTGRTHQLRAHAAALGTPISGDGKYGGADSYLMGRGLSRKLHLHARRIVLPHPAGGVLDVTAPLPPHMAQSWKFFGFDMAVPEDPFAGVE
jgi:23S rRNA pseudouridine955/2504/2580 synthase